MLWEIKWFKMYIFLRSFAASRHKCKIFCKWIWTSTRTSEHDDFYRALWMKGFFCEIYANAFNDSPITHMYNQPESISQTKKLHSLKHHIKRASASDSETKTKLEQKETQKLISNREAQIYVLTPNEFYLCVLFCYPQVEASAFIKSIFLLLPYMSLLIHSTETAKIKPKCVCTKLSLRFDFFSVVFSL